MSVNSNFAKAALPYAEALFNSSQAIKLINETSRDLSFVLDTIEKSAHLKSFLANPLFSANAKNNALSKIFADQLHGHVLNFLYILVNRRRIMLLHSVIQCYCALVNKLQLVIVAEVNSAIPLTELQKQSLEDRLKLLTDSRQVHLIERVNPEVIGGIVIKIGSKVIDMSIDGQLNQMSSYLNGARV